MLTQSNVKEIRMPKIYFVDLYEAGICGDFVKAIGYTTDKEVVEHYKKQYADNDDYYIIIREYDCLDK